MKKLGCINLKNINEFEAHMCQTDINLVNNQLTKITGHLLLIIQAKSLNGLRVNGSTYNCMADYQENVFKLHEIINDL